MLGAYFDESGSDAANSTLIVAGFSSSVDQWGRFSDEWRGVLNDPEYNVACFKAKEFDDGRRGKGPYASWCEEKRQAFMNRLLGVIKRRTFKSFAVTLQKTAYEKTIGPITKAKQYFGSDYSFTGFSCIHMVLHWRDVQYPGQPILFTFGTGHVNEGELKRSATHLRNSDKLIVDLTTDDDRKLPPLQVADLLAFELCSDVRRVEQGKRKYSRYPLERLDEHPNEWLVFKPEGLARIIEDFRPEWDR